MTYKYPFPLIKAIAYMYCVIHWKHTCSRTSHVLQTYALRFGKAKYGQTLASLQFHGIFILRCDRNKALAIPVPCSTCTSTKVSVIHYTHLQGTLAHAKWSSTLILFPAYKISLVPCNPIVHAAISMHKTLPGNVPLKKCYKKVIIMLHHWNIFGRFLWHMQCMQYPSKILLLYSFWN